MPHQNIRDIIIPEDILEKWRLLTELENEINGILLYRKFQEEGDKTAHCVVESDFFTGAGTGATVSRDPQRLRVINQFLQENPLYRVIDAHTHPRRLGEHWHHNFSEGDIATFRDHLEDDPLYIGILFTPERELIWAPDEPRLKVCPPLRKEISEEVQRKIKEAARNIGETLGEFRLGKFPERDVGRRR